MRWRTVVLGLGVVAASASAQTSSVTAYPTTSPPSARRSTGCSSPPPDGWPDRSAPGGSRRTATGSAGLPPHFRLRMEISALSPGDTWVKRTPTSCHTLAIGFPGFAHATSPRQGSSLFPWRT